MTEEIVVYSALCFENPETYAPIETAPSLLQVSKVTNAPRSMTLEEMEKITDKCEKSIKFLDSLWKLGKAAIMFIENEDTQKALKKKLDFLSGVGTIIKGILKFIPGPPNPMVKKLHDLAGSVQEIERKINESFDEMKTHITEVSFFIKVMSPTVVLTRFLYDCINNPGPQALRNFKYAYAKHPPLKLAYRLKSYLAQNCTNPLKIAMNAEKIKTTTTFDKWEKIISNLMGQFLLLEAFGNGLLGIKHEFNWERLFDVTKSVVNSMDDWREAYRTDKDSNNLYWEEVKGYLDNYIVNNTHLSVKDKADEIKKKLDTYLTTDSFYVVVFESATRYSDCDIHCPDFQKRLIECWNRGGCNAFIYRSRDAHKKSPEDYKKMKDDVVTCANNTMRDSGTLRYVIQQQLVHNKKIATDGCIFLVKQDRNVQIRVSNCPDYERGPGYWNAANVKKDHWDVVYYLIASFY